MYNAHTCVTGICMRNVNKMPVVDPCRFYVTIIQGGRYEANSLLYAVWQNFQRYQTTGYLFNITLIFVRCRRSLAVVTSVKYGCNLKDLLCTFVGSTISLTEKLTNGALVTPTPGLNNPISDCLGQQENERASINSVAVRPKSTLQVTKFLNSFTYCPVLVYSMAKATHVTGSATWMQWPDDDKSFESVVKSCDRSCSLIVTSLKQKCWHNDNCHSWS